MWSHSHTVTQSKVKWIGGSSIWRIISATWPETGQKCGFSVWENNKVCVFVYVCMCLCVCVGLYHSQSSGYWKPLLLWPTSEQVTSLRVSSHREIYIMLYVTHTYTRTGTLAGRRFGLYSFCFMFLRQRKVK